MYVSVCMIIYFVLYKLIVIPATQKIVKIVIFRLTLQICVISPKCSSLSSVLPGRFLQETLNNGTPPEVLKPSCKKTPHTHTVRTHV